MKKSGLGMRDWASPTPNSQLPTPNSLPRGPVDAWLLGAGAPAGLERGAFRF